MYLHQNLFIIISELESEIYDTIKRFAPKEIIYTEEGGSPDLGKDPKTILSKLPAENLPNKKTSGVDTIVHLFDAYLKYNYRNQILFLKPQSVFLNPIIWC